MTAQQRIEKRFWARVDKSGGCWIWTGARSGGYGTMRIGGRMAKAHRVSFELGRGPVPSGALVCHRCDNPPCVNPDHLFLGTIADNNRDRQQKGRSKNLFRSDASHPARRRSGSGHWCAKLSDEDVRSIRSRVACGESQTAVAASFSVNAATVSRIVRREWRREVA